MNGFSPRRGIAHWCKDGGYCYMARHALDLRPFDGAITDNPKFRPMDDDARGGGKCERRGHRCELELKGIDWQPTGAQWAYYVNVSREHPFDICIIIHGTPRRWDMVRWVYRGEPFGPAPCTEMGVVHGLYVPWYRAADTRTELVLPLKSLVTTKFDWTQGDNPQASMF